MNILLTLFIVFIVYFVHSGYLKYRKIHPNQLNGPTPLPIIGNLHQLGSSPHLVCCKLHKKFGNIYRLWFGDQFTVIVNDPKLIREMLVDNHESFKYRPVIPTLAFGNEYYGISTSNERWERSRALVMKAIKRTSIQKIYDMLDSQVGELISSMSQHAKTGQPFEMALYAQRFTLSIMFKYIFNEDVSYDEDIKQSKTAELAQLMDEIFKALGSGKLGDFIDVLQKPYYKWLQLTNKSFPLVKKFIRERYDQHLSTIDNENPRDLLDILINEYSSDIDSISSVIATCFDMFLAGNDTTAASIIWFTLRMQEHPEIQDKAYKELKSVVGNRNRVLLTDRPSTPFLNSIIKEGLRLNVCKHTIKYTSHMLISSLFIQPVGPFGLPHLSLNDTMIGKHFIPKGAQVLVNYKGLGFNEEYFKNPQQYDPTRFLNTSNEAYLPFGVGPRSCVGLSLANDEMYTSFSNILLNFKLINTGKPVDDTELFGLTLKPNKFNVFLQSRIN